jgi:hypothetical protein
MPGTDAAGKQPAAGHAMASAAMPNRSGCALPTLIASMRCHIGEQGVLLVRRRFLDGGDERISGMTLVSKN